MLGCPEEALRPSAGCSLGEPFHGVFVVHEFGRERGEWPQSCFTRGRRGRLSEDNLCGLATEDSHFCLGEACGCSLPPPGLKEALGALRLDPECSDTSLTSVRVRRGRCVRPPTAIRRALAAVPGVGPVKVRGIHIGVAPILVDLPSLCRPGSSPPKATSSWPSPTATSPSSAPRRTARRPGCPSGVIFDDLSSLVGFSCVPLPRALGVPLRPTGLPSCLPALFQSRRRRERRRWQFYSDKHRSPKGEAFVVPRIRLLVWFCVAKVWQGGGVEAPHWRCWIWRQEMEQCRRA